MITDVPTFVSTGPLAARRFRGLWSAHERVFLAISSVHALQAREFRSLTLCYARAWEVLILPIFVDQSRMPAGLGYRAPLAGGDPGTEQTIDVMRQLIDRDLASSSFVAFAKNLLRNVPAHDEWSEVESIFDWVVNNIRFTKDPVSKESLYPPSELLKIRSGDCDDIAMLLGALYLAVGYPARLVTVAASAQAPTEFSHVYTEVEVPPGSNNWIAADAARPGAQFGVHPPLYSRRRAWSLTDESYQDLQGATLLRGLGYVRYRTLGGLGQDDGIDWSSIIQTGVQQIPQTIAAAEGMPISTRTGTTYVGTGPYSTYMTPYTPGALTPQAGYPTGTGVSLTASSGWIWPVLIVVGALMLMKR